MFRMAELSAQPTSIQSIYSWYAEDRLYVNRRYQRKLVWTLEEKQRLIESILKKYPIPAVLIAERENEPGSFEITAVRLEVEENQLVSVFGEIGILFDGLK